MLGIVLTIIGIVAASVLAVWGTIKFLYPTDKVMKKYEGSEESKSVLTKKYPEADVRNYSTSNLMVGGIVSILCITLIIGWKAVEDREPQFDEEAYEEETEIIPPPSEQIKTPPPPPPPPTVEVVEDEEIIEEEPDLFEADLEFDEEIEIPDFAAPEPEEVEEEEIFTIVEDMPTWATCASITNKTERDECHQKELLTYLGSCSYPDIAKDNDIEGKVYVQYVINKEGKIQDVAVVRSADEILDAAAVKHISNMPSMTPGKQRGKAVSVQFIVPINFTLSR